MSRRRKDRRRRRKRKNETAVILLVILSGSLETRALLRQLSTDFPRHPPRLVMLRCHEQSSAFTFPCVLFFHFACLSCLKAEAKTKVPSSSPFLIPAVWSIFEQQEAAFRVQSSLPSYFHPSLSLSLPRITSSLYPHCHILILDRYSSLLPPPRHFPPLTDRQSLGLGCCVASLSAKPVTAATCIYSRVIQADFHFHR